MRLYLDKLVETGYLEESREVADVVTLDNFDPRDIIADTKLSEGICHLENL